MAGYSADLLDRVADGISRAQQFWTRTGLGPPERRYEVGYTPPPTEPDPDPEPVVVAAFAVREDAIDARDVLASRAVAAAALAAAGYTEE